LSHPIFFNRQALHLRPDPARVIVRPFKPATEPRDFNAADKTRANHIVERVLGLDAVEVAQLLADVLENFDGRHRNLLKLFEARAREMEGAFDPHAVFTDAQRQVLTFFTSMRSRRRPYSIPALCVIQTKRGLTMGAPASF
jgi:hypothetical protein